MLDIGCGTGLLSIRAINKGASVVGIDINPQMLEIAAKRAEQFDITTLTENNKWKTQRNPAP